MEAIHSNVTVLGSSSSFLTPGYPHLTISHSPIHLYFYYFSQYPPLYPILCLQSPLTFSQSSSRNPFTSILNPVLPTAGNGFPISISSDPLKKMVNCQHRILDSETLFPWYIVELRFIKVNSVSAYTMNFLRLNPRISKA